MRQFFRMMLLALVLVTVALISALTAMQFAIHGREVAIPRLVGMTPGEAERAGAALGLISRGIVRAQTSEPEQITSTKQLTVGAQAASTNSGWGRMFDGSSHLTNVRPFSG